jgi:hypothetical protein
LITGLENLEHFVKNKLFKEAANAIAASNDILEHFVEYKHVTQINQLFLKKDSLCSNLLAIILDEFKNYINLAPNNSEVLYEACLAINAIGDSGINSLKTWFIQFKLAPYEEIFESKKENAVEFADSERRFEWLKRILKEYNQLYDSIFPQSWGFKPQICQDFCRITKLHINEMLSSSLDESDQKAKIDVDVLVRVLNNTINFENNLHIYLVDDFENFNNAKNSHKQQNVLSLQGMELQKKNKDGVDNVSEINANIAQINSSSVIDEIKAKYDNRSENSNLTHERSDPNNTPKYSLFRVKGLISESFDPYMISYVQIEEKKLKDVIDSLLLNDRIEGKLYVSSLHLFNNIKQAMNRCLTFSKSKTFFDLSKIFKNVFRYYTDKVLFINNKNPKFRELSKEYFKDFAKEKDKISDEDLKYTAYIINTCDYCITTINALVDSLRDKIEEKYKNQIFYDDVLDYIKQSYKIAFDVIMNWIKSIANDQFNQGITKFSWVNLAEDLDNSLYVNSLAKQTESVFNNIKDIIAENFCFHILNSLPKIVTECFLMNLYKIKKIDESGAEKMLIHVFLIKQNVLKLYNNVNASHGNKSVTGENDFNLIW